MPDRCRLCTANDREALIDELAGRMWELRRETHGPGWENASPYWRIKFTEFAEATIGVLMP